MKPTMLDLLNDYFENTPKEKILEDWDSVKKYSEVGPPVEEFIQNQKQHIMQTNNWEKRITPENIEKLDRGQVFVFGSNKAGFHAGGAAKKAARCFGAINGEGFGLMGDSFAIPTKDFELETMEIGEIREYVDVFIKAAYYHEEKTFLVTEIGCGIAGYEPKDIAPLFKQTADIENIHLPKRFWEIINTL